MHNYDNYDMNKLAIHTENIIHNLHNHFVSYIQTLLILK